MFVGGLKNMMDEECSFSPTTYPTTATVDFAPKEGTKLQFHFSASKPVPCKQYGPFNFKLLNLTMENCFKTFVQRRPPT